jgi:hypothetical protein
MSETQQVVLPIPPHQPNTRTSDQQHWFLILLACCLCFQISAHSELVHVRHRQGDSHGFLVLRSLEGELLASGDLIQTVKGDEVSSELVFRFKDGSVDDEITVFSQKDVFRLVSDHHIQKGPSFPHPVDMYLDARTGQAIIKSTEDGKEKTSTEHVDVPEDAANGLLLTLLTNISGATSALRVSLVTTSSKPRVVKLAISPQDQRRFRVGQSVRKATDYEVKTEIGGVAGMVAPLTGKQPPDTHVLIFGGRAPTFLQFEGVLYQGGPIWRIDLATPHWLGQSAQSDPKDLKK